MTVGIAPFGTPVYSNITSVPSAIFFLADADEPGDRWFFFVKQIVKNTQ